MSYQNIQETFDELRDDPTGTITSLLRDPSQATTGLCIDRNDGVVEWFLYVHCEVPFFAATIGVRTDVPDDSGYAPFALFNSCQNSSGTKVEHTTVRLDATIRPDSWTDLDKHITAQAGDPVYDEHTLGGNIDDAWVSERLK